MALTAEVRITGTRDVQRALKRLGDSARADTLKRALRKASEPVLDSARSKAPAGDIRNALKVVNIIVESEGEVKSEIGIPGGRHSGFYGLWYELGTGPRVQKKTGRRTGSMPARPFLRPAFDEQTPHARRIFWAEIERALRRAADG